eukprot:TRINITY_DN13680_c1_g1_i1.p1 TRINITY_DN13680_c1_g1~~TRINITY_DN13680_c1_g1_i1.p1  ORF type:complete len:218 (-),score=55.93 TRINITY_DN13680_c1_g1_i1:27-611(-)
MAPADRAEQMRQRLAAKSASRNVRSGPLLALPALKTVLVAGRSLSWFMGVFVALACAWSLFSGAAMPLAAAAAVPALYAANFSRKDLQFQVRACFLALAVAAAVLSPLRTVIHVALLCLVLADLGIGYSILERALYCIPANRPENPDELSIDFVLRVLQAPTVASTETFSLRPVDGKSSDGFDYATSRNERRKK